MGRIAQLGVLVSTLWLAACVDCLDGAELEQAYREGEVQAQELNANEYDKGYAEAMRLDYDDGLADGDAEGYDFGYEDGYYGSLGFPAGYDAGYLDGHVDGTLEPGACSSGVEDGYAAGDYEGYELGWSEGFALAYEDGYADGVVDGEASCELALARVDPDELQICRGRGFDRNLDAGAFARGYEAGRRDNHEYQAGYMQSYPLAYVIGRDHGQLDGYDAGYSVGYDEGYFDGWDATYYVCWDQAYGDGFDAGYELGWSDSLAVGYDEGYAAGFADGGTC